jgi:tripartite-type tricarboxylate transporter receptor subunit TctC
VALGVSSARRSSVLPEVPTVAEAGLANYDYALWSGLWAPAGTPPGVVDKLAKDLARALAAPDLRAGSPNSPPIR